MDVTEVSWAKLGYPVCYTGVMEGFGPCQVARWGTWTSGRGPANAGLPGVLNRGHGGVLGHARLPGGVHGRQGEVQGHAGLPGVLHGGHGEVQDHAGVHGEVDGCHRGVLGKAMVLCVLHWGHGGFPRPLHEPCLAHRVAQHGPGPLCDIHVTHRAT
jgi:hypothetical protein